MIVLDASAALEMLLRTEAGDKAAERVLRAGEQICALHLIDVEIAQVLRRYALSGQVTAQRCSEALQDWDAFRVHRYPHDVLLQRIWALRENLTAYDAAYVALAEAIGAPLLTRDARIAGAPGHSAQIELI